MNVATAERIVFIRHAVRAAFTVEEILNVSSIDGGLLAQI